MGTKIDMPKTLKKECHKIIHTAAAAAATATAITAIPVADTIAITAAQIAMVVSLGKVFGITISNSVAKSILGCKLAQEVGRNLSASILKAIPVVNVTIGPIVNSSIAFSLTEAMGWIVADDFYRISIDEEPENILNESDKIKDLKNLFKTKTKKKK